MSASDEAPTELWLVDGYNVLHALLSGETQRERFWDRASRERLLGLVAAARPVLGPIEVVFDGPHPTGETEPEPAVRTTFAEDADGFLLAQIAAASHPERIALVTRDRELAARARSRGARVVAPQRFLAWCREQSVRVGDGCDPAS